MDRQEQAKEIVKRKNLCGYHGHLARSCSFVRGGCGYHFKAKEGTHCPLCGLDRFCRSKVKGGKTVCRMHGGSSVGRSRLATKLTRRDALPERLQATYESSLQDPGLMELTNDLALSESLITENLQRLNEGDPGEAWLKFRELWRERRRCLREASKADKGDRRREEFLSRLSEIESDLDELIEAGADEWQAINKDIPQQLELRRRLVLTEYTRLEKLQFMVRIDQFFNFSDMLAAAVLQHAPVEAQQKIFNVMAQYLEKGNYKHTTGYNTSGTVDYRLIEGAVVDG